MRNNNGSSCRLPGNRAYAVVTRQLAWGLGIVAGSVGDVLSRKWSGPGGEQTETRARFENVSRRGHYFSAVLSLNAVVSSLEQPSQAIPRTDNSLNSVSSLQYPNLRRGEVGNKTPRLPVKGSLPPPDRHCHIKKDEVIQTQGLAFTNTPKHLVAHER
ncbi:hypothetical protein AAFF_G00069580 [Aldrovandia affinis]|uniref:Uncharacterized protein n=1 Tax=Aldrovandia affinis TaxID=143900 RepID=A0AAD7RZ74_9TELE|nr:hypothetical protein AAFF_G00069580 [Aldrovandia affinis]